MSARGDFRCTNDDCDNEYLEVNLWSNPLKRVVDKGRNYLTLEDKCDKCGEQMVLTCWTN